MSVSVRRNRLSEKTWPLVSSQDDVRRASITDDLAVSCRQWTFLGATKAAATARKLSREHRVWTYFFGDASSDFRPVTAEDAVSIPITLQSLEVKPGGLLRWSTLNSFIDAYNISPALRSPATITGYAYLHTPSGGFRGLIIQLLRRDLTKLYLQLGFGLVHSLPYHGLPRAVSKLLTRWRHEHPEAIALSLASFGTISFKSVLCFDNAHTLSNLVSIVSGLSWTRELHADALHPLAFFRASCDEVVNAIRIKDWRALPRQISREYDPDKQLFPLGDFLWQSRFCWAFRLDKLYNMRLPSFADMRSLRTISSITGTKDGSAHLSLRWKHQGGCTVVHLTRLPDSPAIFDYDPEAEQYEKRDFVVIATNDIADTDQMQNLSPHTVESGATCRIIDGEKLLTPLAILDMVKLLREKVAGARFRGKDDAVLTACFYATTIDVLRPFMICHRVVELT